MATWTIHKKIENNSAHRADVVSSSGNTLVFYARTSDSDITGYKEYVYSGQGTSRTVYTGSVTADFNLPYTEVLIEEWVTNANDVDEEVLDGTRTWWYKGWWSKTGGSNPRRKSLKCRVYRRDSGGTEYELTSFTRPLTTTEVQYTTDVTISEEFSDGDRLVSKWYAVFEGWPEIQV